MREATQEPGRRIGTGSVNLPVRPPEKPVFRVVQLLEFADLSPCSLPCSLEGPSVGCDTKICFSEVVSLCSDSLLDSVKGVSKLPRSPARSFWNSAAPLHRAPLPATLHLDRELTVPTPVSPARQLLRDPALFGSSRICEKPEPPWRAARRKMISSTNSLTSRRRRTPSDGSKLWLKTSTCLDTRAPPVYRCTST